MMENEIKQYFESKIKVTTISEFIELIFKAINWFNRLDNHRWNMSTYHGIGYRDDKEVCYACLGGATSMYLFDKIKHVDESGVEVYILNKFGLGTSEENIDVTYIIDHLEMAGDNVRTVNIHGINRNLSYINEQIGIGYKEIPESVLDRIAFEDLPNELCADIARYSRVDVNEWKRVMKKEILPILKKHGL